MGDIQIVKVLVDPKRVAALMFDNTFKALVTATRNKKVYAVGIHSATLEREGYKIEEIIAAIEKVG